MGRLDGKVALITGAASGIGAATARLFAREGAQVAIVDIRGSAAEEAAASIREQGYSACALEADISDQAQVRNMIEHVIAAYGHLHILHCNAGVQYAGSVEDIPMKLWQRTLGVNLTGTFLCLRFAVPAMKRSGGGAIIITASTAGLNGEKGIAAYSASKGALVILTKQTAIEYARVGIRVNCLCPGWIDTPFNDPIYESGVIDVPTVNESIPLGRQGTPEEVANAALFLASDESSYITGHALVIDGGVTAL